MASSEAVMRHIPEAQKITDIGRAVGLLLRTHKPSQTITNPYCIILYLAPNDCNLNVYGLFEWTQIMSFLVGAELSLQDGNRVCGLFAFLDPEVCNVNGVGQSP